MIQKVILRKASVHLLKLALWRHKIEEDIGPWSTWLCWQKTAVLSSGRASKAHSASIYHEWIEQKNQYSTIHAFQFRLGPWKPWQEKLKLFEAIELQQKTQLLWIEPRLNWQLQVEAMDRGHPHFTWHFVKMHFCAKSYSSNQTNLWFQANPPAHWLHRLGRFKQHKHHHRGHQQCWPE